MRRPLGTGLPFQLTGSSTVDTVFDMSAQPAALQQQFLFLTLYLIIPDGDDSGALDIVQTADGVDATLLDGVTVAYYKSLQVSRSSVVKVLDRLPLRGDSVLTMLTSGDPANQPVFVCGYLEDGQADPPKQLRGLQPSNDLVEPFTYGAVQIEDTDTATVHVLENGYIDEITLYLRAGNSASSPHLLMSDGVNSIDIDLGNDGISGNWQEAALILDGIPVQAQADGGGISLQTTAGSDVMCAWGYFTRR